MKFVAHLALLTAVLCVAATPASAQEPSKPVYRCPGPPVLYTDAISLQEAREKGCRSIEGVPLTIVPGLKPRNGSAGATASPPANGASRPADQKVDPAAQRVRDADARRILGDELRREEDRMAQMQRDFNNGEPERRGDERNYQKYQDRVADMRAAMLRKEADIAAIKREMAKLPQ